jgi:hypothetical protein
LEGYILSEVENSQVVKRVLQTLIDISGRKTTKGLAVIKMADLMKKLQNKYDFLKHVEIKDTRFIEFQDPISVMSDINNIESNTLGKALHDIIKDMNNSLGEDAGHFFIKELRRNIGEDFSTIIEDMGVDLGLMQLEFEVSQMTKKLDKF